LKINPILGHLYIYLMIPLLMISPIKNGLNKLKIKKKKQKINYLLLKDILFQTTQLYGKKLFLKIISPLKTSLFVKSKIN
jgi:hypothetical protein